MAAPLSIIIVNYRTSGMVLDCLTTLAEERAAGARFDVIITDNRSPDDSVAVLTDAINERGWASWVRLVPLPRNGGFAYGNNAGIRLALEHPETPMLFLLNPDTLVRPGAIAALSRFMDDHPDVAIAGPRLEERDGSVQNSAFRFPSFWSELDAGLRLGAVSRLLSRRAVCIPVGDEVTPADWVSGAAMFIRRSVIESIGLLDEGYFMYFEETDYCRRARQRGLEIRYVPSARIVHLVGGATSGEAGAAIRRRPAYWFESRRRYFIKSHGRAYALLADLARIGGHALWRVRRILQAKPDTDPPAFLSDLIRHSVLFHWS